MKSFVPSRKEPISGTCVQYFRALAPKTLACNAQCREYPSILKSRYIPSYIVRGRDGSQDMRWLPCFRLWFRLYFNTGSLYARMHKPWSMYRLPVRLERVKQKLIADFCYLVCVSWKRGGMKPSLLEPDYLSCSVISSHPPKKSRTHVKRGPQLTFARLVEKANAKPKPMAAMKPGDAYPMDTSVDEKRSREGNPAVHRDPLDFDDPALLPSPPPWLIAFITANQATLPVETDDSELLWWFESYKKPLVRISTLKENAFDMSVDGHGQSRRKTNADRLKLGLPPLAPKDLNRPNKPAPWKLGVQLGLVDPAEGETRGDGTYRNNVLQPPQSERQRIWSEIVQAAIRYSEKKEQSKVPVVEALWDLIDYVTTGASHKGKWPMSPFKHPEAANPPPARNPKEKLQLEDSPAGKILRPVMPAAQLQEVDIKPIMPKKEGDARSLSGPETTSS